MEIRKEFFNDNEYLFISESGKTRNGFFHKSTLYINNYKIKEIRTNYFNRTWEAYDHQTEMLNIVDFLINEEKEKIKKSFFKDNNFKRMTPERKEILNNYYEIDVDIIELNQIYKNLKNISNFERKYKLKEGNWES